MTIIDGEFDPEEKEEILTALIEGAESAFGQKFDPDSASVIRAFYEPVAEYLASQQQDISQVLDAAHIDDATGDELDLLAALIGVSRRQATPATTSLRFASSGPVDRTYSVPQGTEAQTDAVDSVVFETDEPTAIKLLDNFESGSLADYGGDTGEFTIQSNIVYEGGNALESSTNGPATMINAGEIVNAGSRFHVWNQFTGTSEEVGYCFGVKDLNNMYRAVIDRTNGAIRLEVVDGGTVSTIGTTGSISIAQDNWYELNIDWRRRGTFEIGLYHLDGTEEALIEVSESVPTYTSGGYGFWIGDNAANVYLDNYTMSETSVGGTALQAGTAGNVGGDSLIVLRDAPNGVVSVTNPFAATGGLDEEPDDDFRERAKTELSEGMRATLPAVINGLDKLEGTRSVTVIANDQPGADTDGRPSHTFEAIVDTDTEHYDSVAERILDRKAAGDVPVGGYVGTEITRTVELVNGQQKDISFTLPTQVEIYIDCDLEKTDTYGGNEQVRDNIVQYIGGELTSGDEIGGELGVSDDVIYFQVVEAIMDVEGVHNITNLEIGTSSSPTGTSDVAIAVNETASANANDGSLDITASDI